MDPAGVFLLYAMNVHVSMFAIAVSAAFFLWPRRHVFLTRQRKRVRILDVVQLSHDTKRFRLGLDDDSRILGLPVGKSIAIYSPNPKSSLIYLHGKWNGVSDPDGGRPEVCRYYTPVTGNDTLGYFDIVVKIYHPGTVTMPDGSNVKWNDGGKGSLFLDGKKPGDEIEIDGPVGCNEYMGRGLFKLSGKNVAATRVGLIAGGTGITPILQIVQGALRDSEDSCSFSLLYANKTEEDILFRELLDDLAKRSEGRFQVHYTLDTAPVGWAGSKGFVCQSMLETCLPSPGKSTLVLMSGPQPMIENVCRTSLRVIGHEEKAIVEL